MASPPPHGVRLTAAMTAVLVVAVVLSAAFLSASSGSAAAPSRIVFIADRAPSVSGEIYRLDPNGHLVDLSNGPFQDSGAVVSPDGRRVAFFSDRSGALSVWESGIDGGGLVQIGPSLTPPLGSPGQYTWQSYYVDPLLCPCEPRLAWQPHGNRVAMIGDQTLFVLAAGQQPRSVMVSKNRDDFLAPGWSPDGRVLLGWDSSVVKAFSASGTPLWSIRGAGGPNPWPEHWSWSPQGLLALAMLRYAGGHVTWSGLRVVDERGHLHFAVRGRITGEPGWSPNGSRLAAVIGHRLEVLTASGRRALSMRLTALHGCRDVVWASSSRVVVGSFDRSGGFNPPKCRVTGVDLRTRRLSSASGFWFRRRSADGKVAAFASQTGGHIAIGAAPTSGGPRKTYARVAACRDGFILRPSPVTSLQFAGRSRSLVFVSYCPAPPTDLYSVEPDGSGLQQITTGAEITDPELSPDGTQIAYSAKNAIGVFDSTDGQIALTTPNVCNALAGETYTPPDHSPSWSPDGRTILFSREDCEYTQSLYTIPASGGTPQKLGLNGDEPAWGPTKIAYVGFPPRGIWTANPDGTNPVQISTDGSDPAWSADGRLAYLTGSTDTTVVVGSTETQLPFTDVTSLAWSPEGTRFLVAARTTQTGPFDLYTVNTDGSDPIQLTQNYDTLAVSWR
jgi:Tol biopolymer transport system component